MIDSERPKKTVIRSTRVNGPPRLARAWRRVNDAAKLQLTPEFECSDAWRRVWMAANREGRTVIELAANGIMSAVEAAEDALNDPA